MPFTIRDLETFEEFQAVRGLQHTIWGFSEENIGLYPPLLYTASKNGGVVLGAFAPGGQLIGFLFSFLGRAGGQWKLCSQTMGVLPEWRGQGIAEALKLAQRERTLSMGLSLITWTFDPLESPNAKLNLHKLQAMSRTYLRNIYGQNFGSLNQGLPTDRLLVEWWLDSYTDRPQRPDHRDALAILRAEGSGDRLRAAAADLSLDHRHLKLPVPPNIQAIKRHDMALALEWRQQVRTAFETYFERGYRAVDFVSERAGEVRQNFYILSREEPTR